MSRITRKQYMWIEFLHVINELMCCEFVKIMWIWGTLRFEQREWITSVWWMLVGIIEYQTLILNFILCLMHIEWNALGHLIFSHSITIYWLPEHSTIIHRIPWHLNSLALLPIVIQGWMALHSTIFNAKNTPHDLQLKPWWSFSIHTVYAMMFHMTIHSIIAYSSEFSATKPDSASFQMVIHTRFAHAKPLVMQIGVKTLKLHHFPTFSDLQLEKNRKMNQVDESSAQATQEISLSIEETNKLRISLGLKPLRIDPPTASSAEDNYAKYKQDQEKKRKEEEMAARIEKTRNERLRRMKLAGKGIAEEEEEDLMSWINKSRQSTASTKKAAVKKKQMQHGEYTSGNFFITLSCISIIQHHSYPSMDD